MNKLLIWCLAFLLTPLGTALNQVQEILGQDTLPDEAEEPPTTTPPIVTPDKESEQEIADYINQLLDDNPVVVERARNELLELGHRAVPQLIQALAHEKPARRYMTCEILVELRDERALPALIKLLEDKEEAGMSIKAIAARALGRLGDASVITPLRQALASIDVDLRYETMRALATLRASEAIPQISKLISDTALTFYDREIRCGAIEALGRLKARTEIPKLIDLLTIKAVEPVAKRAVVEYVIEALERITGKSLGFIPLEAGPERDKLIKKWQDWWAEHKDEYVKPAAEGEPRPRREEPEEKPEKPTGEPEKKPEEKPEEPTEEPKEPEEKPEEPTEEPEKPEEKPEESEKEE